ncbi:hypothetical protein Oweho_0596 [Owenweeksia hongkongensis DSM 17368]|uniref:Lipid/polyisoprenoid-binding YceI-like domain-containing protein n=1 Tax=Owenweeksia hongkongensis (strain DSM 17368 / CIP 108786 / JCM 12287 / NRRL B-23963 / UST20020801) TaxID=926562 RepID=G8R0F1_OWEHD|nr:hypothetical protein [Owenweeksia hongkongensis]AEV31611.1 hypothetical protein Oweho_0596 [Owenweeksia hongkongensis DSM 17368]
MKKLQFLVAALIFMTLSCMACSKDDKNTDDTNNSGNPNSKIMINASQNGNQLDVTVVELIDNSFVPADWAITSAYNSMANLFTLSVAHVSAQPQFNLSLLKEISTFVKGSYNLTGGQLDNTVYRNVSINANAAYTATSGTLKIDKIETIGSAAGISANYIDGSFSFDAVNQADSTDILQVQATFTGVASPKN